MKRQAHDDKVQGLKDTINRLMRALDKMDPHNRTTRGVLRSELDEAKAALLSLGLKMTEVDEAGNYAFVKTSDSDDYKIALDPKILVPSALGNDPMPLANGGL